MKDANKNIRAKYRHYRYFDLRGHLKRALDRGETSFDISKYEHLLARELDGFRQMAQYSRSVTEWMPTTCGGATECYLEIDGEVVAYGITFCSDKDHFCYKRGRTIAFGKAMKYYKEILESEE